MAWSRYGCPVRTLSTSKMMSNLMECFCSYGYTMWQIKTASHKGLIHIHFFLFDSIIDLLFFDSDYFDLILKDCTDRIFINDGPIAIYSMYSIYIHIIA